MKTIAQGCERTEGTRVRRASSDGAMRASARAVEYNSQQRDCEDAADQRTSERCSETEECTSYDEVAEKK